MATAAGIPSILQTTGIALHYGEVDLLIGGEYKGTFYFGDAYPAEYMIQDIYHGTGSQVIELKVTSDNGLWDVFMDYLQIS